MDQSSARSVMKVCLDVTCLCVVGLPILLLYLVGQPYQRGFYCDDESIRYPYRDSTVPNTVLYLVGLGLPVATVLVTEAVHYLQDKTAYPSHNFMKLTIPWYPVICYKVIGMFGLAAACSQLVTDIGKYAVGRLRPHCVALCRPDVDCGSPAARWRYVVDFACTSDATPKRLRDARLSFPSGHSSFSAVAMVFVALYLGRRLTWRGSALLRPVLQLACVSLAWATALSRVSDYKHHWSDVCAGLLIGTCSALLTTPFLKSVYRKTTQKEYYNHENNVAYLQPMTEAS